MSWGNLMFIFWQSYLTDGKIEGKKKKKNNENKARPVFKVTSKGEYIG